jgi:N6-L-threonylcarbamoyladenine synthase
MTNQRKCIVLGIESSCDETAAAVVSDSKKILSNVIYSQIAEHKEFGGVVPEIAARAHLEKIDYVVAKALSDAGITVHDLSAVAGTCGPGLIGGVIVGATFAKAMALSADIPFIAVNHLEAHALSVRLTEDIEFPYLLLLASGGHCQICVVHSITSFEIMGKTIDDSVGESFDKVAKMLQLGYPGGPMVEQIAKNGSDDKFHLPRPLCHKNSCDFSFSGLKTAVRTVIDKQPSPITDQGKADLCASFQRTIADVLSYKMNKAIEVCQLKKIQLKAAVISGGVAANKTIRKAMENVCSKNHLQFLAPPIHICTDNGAMIAWLGVEKLKVNQTSPLNTIVTPRWPMGALPHKFCNDRS